VALNGVVRAAGGVISRRSERGDLEVLLIYRGQRRDWTFPKGKVETGETDEECALREVEEETGLRCELTHELPSTSYHDRKGRAKIVRYWIMTVIKGEAEPRNEVDAVRWLGLRTANSLLTYPRDRELLASFAAVLARAAFAK
jgi:8-oxo-dGTP pyrophosphatase MutT (NUDIX family)